MSKTIHGVLTDTHLDTILPSGEILSTPVYPAPATVEEICALVIEQKLTHLWIDLDMQVHKPDYHLSEQWNVSANWFYDEFEEKMRKGHNILSSLHGKRKIGNSTSWYFNVLFRKYISWETLKKLPPYALLQAIRDLESLIGVEVTTAGGTGWRSFEHANFLAKRSEWLAISEQDLAEIPFEEGATQLVWPNDQERPITEQELVCDYLYCVDRNSSYPCAAKVESMGIGEPTHTGSREFDKRYPGLWNVTITDYQPHPLQVPLLWKPTSEPMWLATPILRMLTKEAGASITVHEAWIFEQYKPVFKQWVTDVWDLRQKETGLRQKLVKDVLNGLFGLLQSGRVVLSTKYRPHWSMQVVAGARAAIWYTAHRIAEQFDLYPCICWVDALVYCSNDIIPTILDREHDLGGYKLKWKLPMAETFEGQTVREILASRIPTNMKLHAFNCIAERIGY